MKRFWNTIINLGVAAGLATCGFAQPKHSEIQEVVEKALPALQQSGVAFASKSGCVSCHHQALPARVTAMARDRGYQFDEKIQTEQTQTILKVIAPAREVLLEGSKVVPQIPATGSHFLLALAAQKYPMDAITTAMVNAIAMEQRADGSWSGLAQRPPISGGEIRETALAVHALDLYAPPGRKQEFEAIVKRARRWLLDASPSTPEESIAYLEGLVWSGANTAILNRAGKRVLELQSADGGWPQLATRESDAYATGEALIALHDAGVLKASDEAYQRGIAYLLRTREQDGSWHVRTRAYPFQPLIDTGYPHGRDQWISAAGTSYALMALMLADPMLTVGQ